MWYPQNRSKADLALIYSDVPCAAAAVYTQNLVKGAPIAVTKRNIADGMARAVICNSGNANTCNADGKKKHRKCVIDCGELHIDASDVIVASTGVIGQVLPIEPIANSVENIAEALSATGSMMRQKQL
ncbi:MAG: bifunctional ornithine acetyltransferase/N-acetylglutamate synthase [Acutalibacteraceae bacterium]